MRGFSCSGREMLWYAGRYRTRASVLPARFRAVGGFSLALELLLLGS